MRCRQLEHGTRKPKEARWVARYKDWRDSRADDLPPQGGTHLISLLISTFINSAFCAWASHNPRSLSPYKICLISFLIGKSTSYWVTLTVSQESCQYKSKTIITAQGEWVFHSFYPFKIFALVSYSGAFV